ncbi:MAG: hypothetical protein AAFV74_23580, partial [Pseudomonadota bacterium]
VAAFLDRRRIARPQAEPPKGIRRKLTAEGWWLFVKSCAASECSLVVIKEKERATVREWCVLMARVAR